MTIFINQLRSIPFKIKRPLCSLGLGSNPSFLILGAQKAGTTSLFKYIEKYAENFTPPIKKELYFFSEKYHKGYSWYKSWFPLKLQNGHITGEATPDYLFYHKCAKRVYEKYPNMKMVVLLRNPIDRAYSQYNFQRNSNKTNAYNPLTFKDALNEELNIKNIPEEFDFYYKYRSYLKRGHYYEQIKEWIHYFPENQILFIESDSFYKETEYYLKEVFSFLNLKFKKNKKLSFKAQNKTEYSEQLNHSTREFLREYYKPHNAKLYSLLNRDFEWN
ncbi:sulfotransferase domain-containing protein [Virgibacillus sp. JSM 102003]|uniref:sulfotransferase domain-containing protein n=1 Tax=Virgibacillus sp. JSM 102003 TaxID=1562108 RepID=UPI0035C17481